MTTNFVYKSEYLPNYNDYNLTGSNYVYQYVNDKNWFNLYVGVHRSQRHNV